MEYDTSDPTLVDLTSNFFVLCTNMKVLIYNYSSWVNIHEEKGYGCFDVVYVFIFPDNGNKGLYRARFSSCTRKGCREVLQRLW